MISKRNEKGFTLVELAIVLVIIGLILGAVMKGQDLVNAARAKRLNTTMNTWQSLAWTYMDRMGYMPGDASRNGIIGDVAATEQATTNNSVAIMAATGVFQNAPLNPMIIGNMSFWVYFGNVVGVTGTNRNVIVICGVANCATAFTAEQLNIIQSIDTSIDQVADAGLGIFRGAIGATQVGYATAYNNRDVGGVTLTIANMSTASAAGTTAPWATTQVAAVWLFDKPF